MEKKLGVGKDFFPWLIQDGCYYVDKTPWIRPVLESDLPARLIIRPRRFGKSLFLSTLRAFLSPHWEHPESTAWHEELFSGLKVLEDRDLCERFMGKVPVLGLGLGFVEGLGFEEAFRCLASRLAAVARNYSEILDDTQLSQEDRRDLAFFSSRDFKHSRPGQEMVPLFVSRMTGILARYYGRPVALLVDEFDVPQVAAARYGYYDEMTALIRALFEPVKTGGEILPDGRRALWKTVMTGCLRTPVASAFDGADNPGVDTVFSTTPDFAGAVGFGQRDVDQFLTYCGLEPRGDEIRRQYGGYNFAGVETYASWNVVLACKTALSASDSLTCSIENCWNNTGYFDVFDEFLEELSEEEADQVQSLVDGGEITFPLCAWDAVAKLGIHRPGVFWTLALYAGYVTLAKPVQNGFCTVRIPNKEVYQAFKWGLYNRFTDRSEIFVCESKALVCAAGTGDAEKLEEALNRILKTCVFKMGEDGRLDPEVRLQIFLKNALDSARSKGRMLISTDFCERVAHSAVVLLELRAQRLGIMIRLRCCEAQERERVARDTLEKIMHEPYGKWFFDRGLKRVTAFGVAVSGRSCAVEVAESCP